MISGITRTFSRLPRRTLITRISNLPQSSRVSSSNPAQTTVDASVDDVDPVCVNQNFEDYRPKKYLLTQFKNLLQCTQRDVEKFKYFSDNLKFTKNHHMIDVLRFLLDQKVPPESILENPWLLHQSKDVLCQKLIYLHEMKPRELPDFVPLLRITSHRLMLLANGFDSEEVPRSHRVYYLSDCLEVEPEIISKHSSMNQFIFTRPFAKLSEILNLMMKYGIEKEDIAKGFQAFKRSSETVELRLKVLKEMEVEKPMPWMTFCSEAQFQRFLKIFKANKEALGEEKSSLEYLCRRLDCDIETMRHFTSKCPVILRMKGTRIKKILDYLLDEEGFNPQDVVKTLRIFSFSLETIKNRTRELKKLGLEASILARISQGQEQYDKYLDRRICGSRTKKEPVN
ncbi:Transcription termination factor, mitochondrial [Sergentomyia squamirostris]